MAFKTALKENTMLYACTDTAKQMLPQKPLPYQGKNIGIAILDTGISPVDDFVLPYNRIVAFRDFVGKKTAPYDDNGHGTHVPCHKSKKSTFPVNCHILAAIFIFFSNFNEINKSIYQFICQLCKGSVFFYGLF